MRHRTELSAAPARFPGSDSEVLLVDCPDRPGLIHLVTGMLSRQGANILANNEFVDRDLQRFFMRSEFVDAVAPAELVEELTRVLPSPATVRVARPGRQRIVALVTREHHCLGELLLRHAHGELGASLLAVVGNHDTLRPLTEQFGLPFHYAPHDGRERLVHEADLLAILDQYRPDYLVLAKYMRVLSPSFLARYPNQIINIHHSFLPAFAGAHPYRQAFARGVKIIGATAHFVTEVLDEGPIIAQDVISVDHSHDATKMAQAGRDVEKLVLAKALGLVFEERVFLCGRRTIVFD